ncbi:hypothetical protein D3C81_2246160 [compost metagenome]
MVLKSHKRHTGVQPHRFLQHFVAVYRMALHLLKLAGGKLAGFVEDVVRDADFAYIMKGCA